MTTDTKAVVALGSVIAAAAFFGGVSLLIGNREARFERTSSINAAQTERSGSSQLEVPEQFAEASSALQNAVLSCAPRDAETAHASLQAQGTR